MDSFYPLKSGRIKYFLTVLMFTLTKLVSIAQNQDTDIYELDLSQLTKVKIVSANKVSQDLKDIPSTIHVITGEQIKESGYFTLEEVLSSLPGFQFRNIMSFNSYVFQRGVTNQNNYILLLIDGIQVNELNSGGFYGGGQYNLSNIKRIEVISGPASVAYGTNAITGIINIITNDPSENKVEVNALAGSFNTYKGDFITSFINKNKTLGINFSGMYKTTEKGDLMGSSGDFNWTDSLENYETDYALDLKLKTKDFTFGTNYLQKQSSTSTSTKSVETAYRDYGTLWNIRFINNYLRYSKQISNAVYLSSVIYNRNATVLNNSVQFVTDTAQIEYYRPNNLIGFDNIAEIKANKNLKITSGLTFEYERLAKKFSITYSTSPDLKPPTPPKPEMLSNYLASIFVEPKLILVPNLIFSGGIRFDNSSVYNQVLTPRAGIVFSKSKYHTRLSYADAFRAPKPWDYTDGLGNNSLKPERMRSLELALTYQISEGLKADFVGYRNKLDNAIAKENVTNGFRWINSGEVNTNGFEFDALYSTKKVTLNFNYTFNQSLNEKNKSIPEISKHIWNAGLLYSLTSKIRFDLRANYTGERENPKLITSTNSKTIHPNIVFHGAISLLNYNNFSVQFIVKNILNKEYYHTSNRDPERYRQPQRTIMFTIGYAINQKND